MRKWIDESTKSKIKRIGKKYGITEFNFKYYPYRCSLNRINIYLRGFFEDDHVKFNPLNSCPYSISTDLTITSPTQYSNHIGNLEKIMQFVTALQPLAEEWNNTK